MLDLEISWSGESHTLKLDDGEHSLGRAGDNAIKVLAGRVSKHHAVVRVDGTRLFVRDLGSTNGTEIEGHRLGKEEVEVPTSGAVNFSGAVLRRPGASTATTAALASDNLSASVRYNMREGYTDTARDRIMDMSSGLFELLASDKDAAEIGKAACAFVAKTISADRVVLLEDSGEATSIEPRARWTKKGDDTAPLRLSSTIINEVQSQRETVLVPNPLEDPNYTGQESIVALHLRSAMAAPLFDNERVRGILYVDTANANVRYKKDDLQVLTATANAVAVKLRNLTLESEMRTAALIQRAMLPRKLQAPEGYEIEAYQLMCRSVGGDLYHCSPRDGGKTLFALGDVSGKGTPAALAMGAAIVLIGMLSEIDDNLDLFMTHIHHQLYRSLGAEQFITLFVGEIEATTGKISYVNAGHEPPLIIHQDGTMDQLPPTGLPVAMIEEVISETAEAIMQPGDLLAVFSDGIPEATTNGETFLGLDPVKKILIERRNESLTEIRKHIVSAVENFLAGDPMSDDVTLVLLRRTA